MCRLTVPYSEAFLCHFQIFVSSLISNDLSLYRPENKTDDWELLLSLYVNIQVISVLAVYSNMRNFNAAPQPTYLTIWRHKSIKLLIFYVALGFLCSSIWVCSYSVTSSMSFKWTFFPSGLSKQRLHSNLIKYCHKIRPTLLHFLVIQRW